MSRIDMLGKISVLLILSIILALVFVNFKILKRRIYRSTQESVLAHVFNDSIKDVDWIKTRTFSPHGHSANYSFLYILFRVLDDVCPNSIIEFGVGQTSRLTSQYAAFKNKNSKLLIIDDNQLWIDLFKNKIPSAQNIEIKRLDTYNVSYKKSFAKFYKGLKDGVGDEKFDLVINDGAMSDSLYQRIYVLDLIPQNLADSFVIIVDDYRPTKDDTVKEILAKLDFCNIKYGTGIYSGERDQFIIFSPKFNYLKTL